MKKGSDQMVFGGLDGAPVPDANPIITPKVCKKCNTTWEAGWKQCKQCAKNREAVDGKTCKDCGAIWEKGWKQCMACHAIYARQYYIQNLERIRARRKELVRANPGRKRNQFYNDTYGITLKDYEKMAAEQGGRCAICGSDKPGKKGSKYLYVDHNHATGLVRGLLCYHCNIALGMAKESLETLEAMAKYLRKHKQKPERNVIPFVADPASSASPPIANAVAVQVS